MSDARITIRAEDLASAVLKAVSEQMAAVGDTASTSSAQSTGAFDAIGTSAENTGGFVTELGEKVTDFVENPLSSMKSGITGVVEGLGPMGVGLTVLGGIAAAVGGEVFELGEKAARTEESIHEFSVATGESIEQTERLKAFADLAGSSLDDMTGFAFKLQKQIDTTGAAQDKFQAGLHALNINVDEFKQADLETQMVELSEGFNKGAVGMNNMTAALDILGPRGRQYLGMLTKDLTDVKKEADDVSLSLGDADVKAGERMEVQINKMKESWSNMGTSIGAYVVPALTTVFELVGKIAAHPLTGGAGEGQFFGSFLIPPGQLQTAAGGGGKDVSLGSGAGADTGISPDILAKSEALWADYNQYVAKGADDRADASIAAVNKWYTTEYASIAKAAAKHSDAWSELDALNAAYYARLTAANSAAQKTIEQADEEGRTRAQSLWDAYYQSVDHLAGDSMAAKIDGVNRWYDQQYAAIVKSKADWSTKNDEIAALDSALYGKLGEIQKTFQDSVNQATTKEFKGLVAVFPDMTDEIARANAVFHPLETSLDYVASVALPDVTSSMHDTAAATHDLANMIESDLDTALMDFPKLVQTALTSGGGISKAVEAAGAGLGSQFGQQLFNSSAVNNTISNGVSKLFGEGAASGISLALPGIGAALGSLVGPLISAIGNIGGPSQAEKDARSSQDSLIASLQQTAAQSEITEGILTDNYHTIAIGARDAFMTAGASASQAEVEVKALLNTHDPVAFAAAMKNLDTVMASNAQHVTDVKTAVDGVTTAAKAYGTDIPKDMQATILQLEQMPGLTDAEKASLQGLVDAAKPNYDQLTSLASNYGITLEGLGPKFQQANIDSTAKTIFKDFTDLTSAGADTGGVLLGMSGKILDLVTHSREFGEAIPENMRPLIQSLEDSGALSDDFKAKLGLMSDMKFEDTPVDTGLTGMQTSLDKLKDSITGPDSVSSAVQTLLNSIPNNPFANWVMPSGAGGQAPPSFANEGYDLARPMIARVGDAKGDTESILHARTVRDIVTAARTAGSQTFSNAVESKLDALNGVMLRVHDMLRDQPNDLARAFRGAMAHASA